MTVAELREKLNAFDPDQFVCVLEYGREGREGSPGQLMIQSVSQFAPWHKSEDLKQIVGITVDHNNKEGRW